MLWIGGGGRGRGKCPTPGKSKKGGGSIGGIVRAGEMSGGNMSDGICLG